MKIGLTRIVVFIHVIDHKDLAVVYAVLILPQTYTETNPLITALYIAHRAAPWHPGHEVNLYLNYIVEHDNLSFYIKRLSRVLEC